MVRADARENRVRILDAARQAFAETGEVSMNRIAQQARVGAGTLYRNFPTRESLVLAVYQQEVDRIVDGVDPLLDRLPAKDALREWTMALVDAMLHKHGLGDAISAGSLQEINEQTYGPVIAAITRLLDAGKADGSIRTNADPDDYLQLTGALWRAKAGGAARADRMLAVILDGLSPR